MAYQKHTLIEKHQNQIFIFGENLYFRSDGKISTTPLRRIVNSQGAYTADYDKEKGHISLSHIDLDHPDNNPELDDKVKAYCEWLRKPDDFKRIKSITLDAARKAKDNLEHRHVEVGRVKGAVDTVFTKCLEMQWVLGFEKPVCHTHFDPGMDDKKFTNDNLFQDYPGELTGSAGGRNNLVCIAGSINPPEYLLNVVREEFGHIVDKSLGAVVDDGQRKMMKHASFHILNEKLDQIISGDKASVERFKQDETDNALWKQFDWKNLRVFSWGMEPLQDPVEQRNFFIGRLDQLLKLDGYEDAEPHWRCSEHMVKLHVLRQALEDLTIGKKVKPLDYFNSDLETSLALQMLDKVLPHLSKAYREEWLPKVRQKLLTDLQLASPVERGNPVRNDGQSWAKATTDKEAWVRC